MVKSLSEYQTVVIVRRFDINQYKEKTIMSPKDIVRAWKDNTFRQSLSEEERALLPTNPAGMVELSDAQLSSAVGGDDPGATLDPAVFTCTVICSTDGGCDPSEGCTLDECGITSAICSTPACTYVAVHC
jgi:mersacidin/lichenicidin family type 2 lantibiotic